MILWDALDSTRGAEHLNLPASAGGTESVGSLVVEKPPVLRVG